MEEFLCAEEKSPLHFNYKKGKMNTREQHTLYVVKAEYAGEVSLRIYFSDGTSRTVDFAPFLQSHPHPQYNRYSEPRYFKKFSIEHGNVVWGKNWDMVFPVEQLHRGIVA